MAESQSSDRSKESRPTLGYGGVFLILAAITAVEIWLGTAGLARSLRTIVFMAFSLAKAALVAAYFMHLKSDSRLYSYIFLAPAVMLLVFALITAVP